MQKEFDNRSEERPEKGALQAGAVSRRQFLKLAGVAGAAVGMGAGVGGLLAACGEETAETTTTAAAGEATTTTAAATTTTAGATTTVAAEPEMGREIKLGFCTPLTGPLASFGVPDQYCVDRWREAIGDGMVLGDNKMHPISIQVQDTQSDSNRASQVAGDLINNTGIDLMMVASTPETVKPTVEQCEAYGVPVVSTDCPWQTYLGANFEQGYKWSYHVFFGGEDLCAVTLEAFNQVPSNKIAGGIFSNEASGNFFRDVLPPFLEANGYKVEVGDTVQLGTEDYTSVISAFKKAGAELLTGNMYPPDFTNFYKQSIQQGWQPKVPFCSKATLFPQSVDSLGEVGNGVMKELWWHRTFPFKSSLSGETCAELADNFEATTGKQQTSPLLHYVVGEMAVYALKNSADPTNKDATLAAIETMKVDTIVGTIDFTAPIAEPLGPKNTDFAPGPGHKRKNVYDHGLAGAQWIMGGGKFKFTENVTGNAAAPYLTADLLVPIQPVPITG